MSNTCPTTTLGLPEIRRATRLDVRLKASLRETGAGKFLVDVIDMSVSGCRLHTSFTLSPGARVWITIPGMSSIECEIAWKNMFVYGCKFLNPLHAAVLDHLVSRFRDQPQ
jgi:PilZ domain